MSNKQFVCGEDAAIDNEIRNVTNFATVNALNDQDALALAKVSV